MSVSETVNLTGQPAEEGQIRIVPLGGNGIQAPKSMYEVQITLSMDASGGECAITFTRDSRWQSICTLFNGTVEGAAAGVEIMFEAQDAENSGPVARGFANATPIASVVSLNVAVWNPPPIMTMTRWTVRSPNVNGDKLIVNAWLYNFNRRILELSPMWQILANLPRSGRMDMAPNS